MAFLLAAAPRPSLFPIGLSQPELARARRSWAAPCHLAARQCRPAQPMCAVGAGAGSAAAAADPTTAAAEGAQQRWEEFAANAAGEWDGMTATFDATGAPQPLPEYYVPQAFAEWGVTLYDWQSQCSSRADDAGLATTHRRMMPTVGCEADAVAFTSQQQQVFVGPSPASTVAPDGSYSAGPDDLSAPDLHRAAVEACLVLQPREQRVRLVLNLRRAGEGGGWQLASIDVHSERWEGPYDGKLELRACGGMDGFAEGRALEAGSLVGEWRVIAGAEWAIDAAGISFKASPAAAGATWLLGGEAPVLLPLGAWAAVEATDSGDVAVTKGVLLQDGGMRVASRLYSNSKLSSVALLTLARS